MYTLNFGALSLLTFFVAVSMADLQKIVDKA